MVSARARTATYDDYLALPEGAKAELIDGQILMTPQPKGRHVRFASQIGARLNVAFSKRGGSTEPPEGPGGWWIFFEPECHLEEGRRVVVPDLAGWRRERMPEPPSDEHRFLLVPDWVCEILSPSTASRDNLIKMPRYLEAGVKWAWLVDPVAHRIDVFRAGEGEWLEVGGYEGQVRARIPPFDAIELELASGWSPG